MLPGFCFAYRRQKMWNTSNFLDLRRVGPESRSLGYVQAQGHTLSDGGICILNYFFGFCLWYVGLLRCGAQGRGPHTWIQEPYWWDIPQVHHQQKRRQEIIISAENITVPKPCKKKKNHSLILNRKKNEPWLRDWKLCLKGCNQGKRASMNLQLHKCQINITRGQKSVLSKLSSIWNLSLFYKQNPS